MKALVAVDIAHLQDAFINQLNTLMDLANSEIILLYVIEQLPAYESIIDSFATFEDDFERKLSREAHQKLTIYANKLKTLGAHPRIEVVAGPPHIMIQVVAQDHNCDWIVVSPGQHSAVEKFFLGSVSSKVIQHAPTSVLVVRANGDSNTSLKNVIVGVDSSQESKHAVETTAQLFKQKEITPAITLVHVVDIAPALKFTSPVEFISRLENNLLMKGEVLLSEAKNVFERNGIKSSEILLTENNPPARLIACAEEKQAELIVLGTQTHDPVKHIFMGSTAQRVVTHAPCSVALVKG